MKKTVIYIGLAILSLTACTKVIDVDLKNQIDNRLVVEASIVNHTNDPNNGYQEILLSRSRAFFEDVEVDNSIKNALVTVTNNQTGEMVTFTESSINGKYTTNDLKVKVGNGYTLDIQALIEGEIQNFQGTDSIVASPPEIDSITLEGEIDFESGDSLYEINITALNPPNTDYFKFEAYINDSLIINDNQGNNFFFSLFEDSFLGDTIKDMRINDQEIDPNEEIPDFEIKVKMKRISYKAFNYWRRLYANASGGDDTPQTIVKGNVKNLTYPEQYPLGVFMTSSESERTVLITEYPEFVE